MSRTLSAEAKALLTQPTDTTLSVHPLGAIHARRLTTRCNRPAVSREGLWAAIRYAELHNLIFASRRTQMSACYRLYVATTMTPESDLTDAQLRRRIDDETRLTNAELALREAGDLSRRLVRNMALFDQWPSFLIERGWGRESTQRQLDAVKQGLDGLERALFTARRKNGPGPMATLALVAGAKTSSER
ncbi:MAG: hypothetical protein O7A03_11335 [Alphaproteobacteria bacterium]|nr:hypothetical protein [Alphaproteobacteria bacterium]